jgi:hypothetical protein
MKTKKKYSDCDCGGCEECVYGTARFMEVNGIKKDSDIDLEEN